MSEERKKNWVKAQKNAENCLQQKLMVAASEEDEDLKAQLSQLKAIGDSICNGENDDTVGPLYPCVVFHDGDGWLACVDCAFNETENDYLSDMSVSTCMREYHINGEYKSMSTLDCLNYGIHVYDDGNILSIFTMLEILIKFTMLEVSCIIIIINNFMFNHQIII